MLFSRSIASRITSLSLVLCAMSLVSCSDSNNVGAGETIDSAAIVEATTAVTAASMLAENVTSNVSQIRISAIDEAGEEVSTDTVSRLEAESFLVSANAERIEMGLLTPSDKQIGVIIFKPEGDAMTLSLPGEGLSPNDVLNLDIVINADLWDSEPRMMAAGLGFSNIMGVPGVTGTDANSQMLAIEAGASWNTVAGCGDVSPGTGNYTSALAPSVILLTTGQPGVTYAGGMPVEFSWPALSSTVQGADFLVTLNDYTQVYADVATATPNFDYNERASIVLFGQFGNRLELNDPDVLYPVRIEVFDDGTPLMLIAPDGSLQSAVGMFAIAPGSPYHSPGVGPKLTGAKLNRMSAIGDSGPPGFTGNTPNDGIALYGDDAQYRLRVYTTGGFTPDGVVGLKPNQYNNFFQVQAKTDAGELIPLRMSGQEYVIDGKKIEVVGLAELGPPGQVLDGNDCYNEDKDNQIDIILKGDVEAMRKITVVRVPSQEPAGARTADGYWQFYNPGGPGNNPTEGTAYTQGSPDHTVPVVIAIDDPMTVTYIDLRVAD